MDFTELFEQIRNEYIYQFEEATKEYNNSKISFESPFYNKEGNVVKEGFFDIPARGDFFILVDEKVNKILWIDSEKMVSFENFSFDFYNLEISMSPFQWDWLVISFSNKMNKDLSFLKEWFYTWFYKYEDEITSNSFQHVIHFMSDPQEIDEIIKISLDLGSAPTDCIHDLLDRFESNGLTKILLSGNNK